MNGVGENLIGAVVMLDLIAPANIQADGLQGGESQHGREKVTEAKL